MAKEPIEIMLDKVNWVVIPRPDDFDSQGIPYATHRGILNIMGNELECFILDDGRRIFSAESIHKLFQNRLILLNSAF